MVEQTVKTQIRLLLEEQSDPGPHCYFTILSSPVLCISS